MYGDLLWHRFETQILPVHIFFIYLFFTFDEIYEFFCFVWDIWRQQLQIEIEYGAPWGNLVLKRTNFTELFPLFHIKLYWSEFSCPFSYQVTLWYFLSKQGVTFRVENCFIYYMKICHQGGKYNRKIIVKQAACIIGRYLRLDSQWPN